METDQQGQYLLIEPMAESLAPNAFKIIPVKKLISGENAKFRLRVTNCSSSNFPGGLLKNIALNKSNKPGAVWDDIPSQIVPKLARDASVELELGTWHVYGVGWMQIGCDAESGGKPVWCYQTLPGSGAQIKIEPKGRWVDFVAVSTKAEVNQQYTNYILIALTFVTVIYYGATLIFEIPF